MLNFPGKVFVQKAASKFADLMRELVKARKEAKRKHQIGPGQRTHPRQLDWRVGGTYKVTHDRLGRKLKVPYLCRVGRLVSRDPYIQERVIPGMGGKRERQRRINQMKYVNRGSERMPRVVPMHSGAPVTFLR